MAEKTYRFYIRQGDFELDLEGDQKFVESYLEAFLESEALLEGAPTGRSETKPALSARGAVQKASSTKAGIDAVALAAHMAGRRPKNHKERILLYFGFLTSKGMREWGTAQLEACFAAAGVRFPAAGRQYFQILKKQGLVEKGSGWGLWRLTAKGAALIEALGKPAQAEKAKAPKRAKTPKRAKAAPAKAARKRRKTAKKLAKAEV